MTLEMIEKLQKNHRAILEIEREGGTEFYKNFGDYLINHKNHQMALDAYYSDFIADREAEQQNV